MPDLPVLLVVLVLLAAGAGTLVVLSRRARDPLAQRFRGVSERRGWSRRPLEDARSSLARAGPYLDSSADVDVAIGGHGIDAQERVTIVAIGTRRPMVQGRPWYVAVVEDDRLPPLDAVLEPRSVRTVRLVAGEQEVVVADERIARGWRITSDDPHVAAATLDAPGIRDEFGDVLHRPMPWIIGLRLEPGIVAVHLSRPEESPSDVDELDRFARLALEVARALRSGRSASSPAIGDPG